MDNLCSVMLYKHGYCCALFLIGRISISSQNCYTYRTVFYLTFCGTLTLHEVCIKILRSKLGWWNVSDIVLY